MRVPVVKCPEDLPLTAKYRLVLTREQMLKESYRLSNYSETETLCIMNAEGAKTASGDIEMYKAVTERGVRMRFITEVTDQNLEDLYYSVDTSTSGTIPGSRTGTIPTLTIFDRRTVRFGTRCPRLGLNSADSIEPTLIVEDPQFAEAFTLFFEALWEDSL